MLDRNWKWFTFKAKAELTDVIYQYVKQQIPTSPSFFPSKILFITPPSKMCIHKVPFSISLICKDNHNISFTCMQTRYIQVQQFSFCYPNDTDM